MYEPSKLFADFHIAGFAFWDGLEVIDSLSLGAPVTLKIEPDNPYDPEAVALYYGETKLGFVPREENSTIAKLLYFGHDVFNAKISQVNKESHPSKQVRVSLMLKDCR